MERGLILNTMSTAHGEYNHPPGRLGGWTTSRSAEEILDRQRQRVDIPAHARTAHNGLSQKRLEEDLC